MKNINYRPMKITDQGVVQQYIKALYKDDPDGKVVTDEQIVRTFERLAMHPDYGIILVFEFNKQIIGYTLLINFWSNEYGGILLTIDELFIIPGLRNQGMGTAFIRYLIASHYHNFVALKLEVLPYNSRALKLYESLGFKQADRHHLIFEKYWYSFVIVQWLSVLLNYLWLKCVPNILKVNIIILFHFNYSQFLRSMLLD